jgi:hypothetical protein
VRGNYNIHWAFPRDVFSTKKHYESIGRDAESGTECSASRGAVRNRAKEAVALDWVNAGKEAVSRHSVAGVIEAIVFTDVKCAIDVTVETADDKILGSAFPPSRCSSNIGIRIQEHWPLMLSCPESCSPTSAMCVPENCEHIWPETIERNTYLRVVCFPESQASRTTSDREELVGVSF